MKPEDVTFIDFKEEKYYGPLLPSSEWRMHLDLYRGKPDCLAVVHAHPIFSTTLSILNVSIPAYHYMIAAAGGDSILCAEYATFGTKVRFNIQLK